MTKFSVAHNCWALTTVSGIAAGTALTQMHYFSAHKGLGVEDLRPHVEDCQERLSREDRIWTECGKKVEVDPTQEERFLVFVIHPLTAVYGASDRRLDVVSGTGMTRLGKLWWLPFWSSEFVEGDTPQTNNLQNSYSFPIILGDGWEGNAGPSDSTGTRREWPNSLDKKDWGSSWDLL